MLLAHREKGAYLKINWFTNDSDLGFNVLIIIVKIRKKIDTPPSANVNCAAVSTLLGLDSWTMYSAYET